MSKRSTHFHQELSNQLITSIIVLDEKLTISYVNPAAEALLKKSASKLIQLPINELFTNAPIDKSRLHQLFKTGQDFSDSEVTLTFKNKRQVTVELSASSVIIENTDTILLELKQIDQTKQISDEVFIQQQWESARDLIRGLAHEIKNPLGGLRGAAQLLDMELVDEKKEYTKMIIDQADRLTNLVDRLLGPNQLPIMEEQNIHFVLEKVLQLSEFDNPKNIVFKRDYDPSLPHFTFDQDKLQQTILNIVNNAMQVISPQQSITLKTRAAMNKTINGKRTRLCVKISIIDDGPGIPEEIKDTLFYPMISGRSSSTGLGLSICQTIIQQHRGKLSCKSQPGHTEFEILLPLNNESYT